LRATAHCIFADAMTDKADKHPRSLRRVTSIVDMLSFRTATDNFLNVTKKGDSDIHAVKQTFASCPRVFLSADGRFESAWLNEVLMFAISTARLYDVRSLFE
jgi:hypothetical protein